jgi:glutamyl-tRNA synthetase
VLGPDGTRLAKRHGAVTLADRLARGESAAAVRAELARSVGLTDDGQDTGMRSMLDRFDPSTLPTEPTVLEAA